MLGRVSRGLHEDPPLRACVAIQTQLSRLGAEGDSGQQGGGGPPRDAGLSYRFFSSLARVASAVSLPLKAASPSSARARLARACTSLPARR